nr:MAG TPA: hypothetical protein [Caudoviricetes sp.]
MEIKYPIDNLLYEILSDNNLYESFDYVVSHLENKSQRDKYRPEKDKIIEILKQEIGQGLFRITMADVKNIHVKDGPKERDCQAPTVIKRIGCHAIMVIFEKYVYPSLIKNSAASIKGKGMHWLHHIIEEDIANNSDNMTYFYKCDIKGFYDNISQELIKKDVRRYTSDKLLLQMLDSFITLMPSGLSKGLRSSQCLANIHLSNIDHLMCSIVGNYMLNDEKRFMYYRYCDDITIFSADKKELWKFRDILHGELAKLGLSIKPNEAVRPLNTGLDFLGFVNYGTYSLLRKRTKQNAARKLSKVKSRKRRQEIIGAFKGMACHADCKHLFYILTNQRMKKFSEMGITYTPADGKKRFPGKMMRLSAIQNKTIEIHDYESNVTTEHGEDRYIVSFRDPKTQEWGKFFTASEEMKAILDQISDIEDGFPFETIIESEVFDGNKIKYKFT